MTNSLKIGVLGADLIEWGGGIDLLRIILGGLNEKSHSDEICITLLLPPIPGKMSWAGWFHQGASALFSSRSLQGLKEVYWQYRNARKNEVAREKIISALTQSGAKFTTECYENQDHLTHLIAQGDIQAIIPSLHDLGTNFPIPWIGYIPDFQHMHLPEQFAPDTLASRNEGISRLLESAPAIIATSQDVMKDIKAFSPGFSRPIVVLPFAPLPFDEWFEDDQTLVAEKYGLPTRYFLISNQFWRHKSHITAIEALALLKQDGNYSDVKLICTGSTHDYRNPGYFEELKHRIDAYGLNDAVAILGYIPKRHQIEIMKKAVSLIQPTLFEGSQGGLAVYDAVGLGVRAIVSDIPVNLEIQDPLVSFFRAGSAEDLKCMMVKAINEKTSLIDKQLQMQLARQRISRLGDQLLEAINAATKHHVKPQ